MTFFPCFSAPTLSSKVSYVWCLTMLLCVSNAAVVFAKPEATTSSFSAQAASPQLSASELLPLLPVSDAELQAPEAAPQKATKSKRSFFSRSKLSRSEKRASSEASANAAPSEGSKGVMVDITSKTLQYEQESGAYVATGLVHVVVAEQNSELEADKVTYDKEHNTLVAEGHVKITRGGQVTEGSVARVDLNRDSALISDPNTKVETVRIKAEKAYVDKDYIRMENGRFIINRAELVTRAVTGSSANNPNTPTGNFRQPSFGKMDNTPVKPGEEITLALRTGYQPYYLNSPSTFDFVDKDFKKSQPKFDPEFLEFYKQEDGIQLDTSSLDTSANSNFKFRVKDLEVQQYDDNYQKITAHWPKLTYKNVPLFTYPSLDVGFDKDSGRFDYLGPEIGFNRDLGGAYAGPGFDFKAGQGVVKLSPLLSYGPEIKRDGGSFSSGDTKPGIGVSAKYFDDTRYLEYIRTSQVNYNVFYGTQRLFYKSKNPFLASGLTQLAVSANRTYNANLLTGIERPAFSAQATDSRLLWSNRQLYVRSYLSAGAFKDDFNPTNRSTYFVKPDGTEPQTAGRVMAQFVAASNKPVFKVGDKLEFGYMGQVSAAAYSTGDHLLVVRGGPTVNFRAGDRFLSQAYYALGGTSGKSPFVFDSFFLGSQALSLNNAVRVNKYLTIGARQDLNITRNNAADKLLVGNVIYLTVGPADMKFNIGFDVVRQTTFFGLNMYPSLGFTTLGFDSARIYQPSTVKPEAEFKKKKAEAAAAPASEEPAYNPEAPSPFEEENPVSPSPEVLPAKPASSLSQAGSAQFQ